MPGPTAPGPPRRRLHGPAALVGDVPSCCSQDGSQHCADQSGCGPKTCACAGSRATTAPSIPRPVTPEGLVDRCHRRPGGALLDGRRPPPQAVQVPRSAPASLNVAHAQTGRGLEQPHRLPRVTQSTPLGRPTSVVFVVEGFARASRGYHRRDRGEMAEAVRQMNPHRCLVTINGGVRETDREWLRDLAIERQAETTRLCRETWTSPACSGSFPYSGIWTSRCSRCGGCANARVRGRPVWQLRTGGASEPPTADGGWRGCGYCTGVTTRSLPARAPRIEPSFRRAQAAIIPAEKRPTTRTAQGSDGAALRPERAPVGGAAHRRP